MFCFVSHFTVVILFLISFVGFCDASGERNESEERRDARERDLNFSMVFPKPRARGQIQTRDT